MLAKSTVLIVIRCDESREVLRTALTRRGLRVIEARGIDGLALARGQRPELVVLDLESAADANQTAYDFAAAVENTGGRLVILGSAEQCPSVSADEFVSKPYHFKPLVLRIEELLHHERGRAAA